jgi:hypothetical protein
MRRELKDKVAHYFARLLEEESHEERIESNRYHRREAQELPRGIS